VEVAEAAGVSIATVSRVFSNKPHVRPELHARVLAAAAALGYQPSRVARSLRMQRSQVFGLIVSDIQNPFFTTLARAVEDVAHRHQHTVFFCNSDEDIEKEKLYIDLMEAEQVAGVIISPTTESSSACQWLIEAGIPVVVVDRRLIGLQVDTVLVDNMAATASLVAHLIADGHRRIGAMTGLSTSTTGHERLAGYTQALRNHDLPLAPALVRQAIPTEAMGAILAADLLDSGQGLTAVFAGNGQLAAGALREIRRRKLRIPDDIALVAFDEVPWMALVEPALTVIRQPIYEMGLTAADLLLRRLEDDTVPPREHVLPATLEVRQSCAHHA
jgi:DNA-binding LacI/PurR family transcriptional regulator